ncbi:hypothetical protein SNEBB_009787 [Seison nebaliae]|nr:hypothetical protein SNEBB_009787 [Seison nebaliae]
MTESVAESLIEKKRQLEELKTQMLWTSTSYPHLLLIHTTKDEEQKKYLALLAPLICVMEKYNVQIPSINNKLNNTLISLKLSYSNATILPEINLHESLSQVLIILDNLLQQYQFDILIRDWFLKLLETNENENAQSYRNFCLQMSETLQKNIPLENLIRKKKETERKLENIIKSNTKTFLKQVIYLETEQLFYDKGVKRLIGEIGSMEIVDNQSPGSHESILYKIVEDNSELSISDLQEERPFYLLFSKDNNVDLIPCYAAIVKNLEIFFGMMIIEDHEPHRVYDRKYFIKVLMDRKERVHHSSSSGISESSGISQKKRSDKEFNMSDFKLAIKLLKKHQSKSVTDKFMEGTIKFMEHFIVTSSADDIYRQKLINYVQRQRNNNNSNKIYDNLEILTFKEKYGETFTRLINAKENHRHKELAAADFIREINRINHQKASNISNIAYHLLQMFCTHHEIEMNRIAYQSITTGNSKEAVRYMDESSIRTKKRKTEEIKNLKQIWKKRQNARIIALAQIFLENYASYEHQWEMVKNYLESRVKFLTTNDQCNMKLEQSALNWLNENKWSKDDITIIKKEVNKIGKQNNIKDYCPTLEKKIERILMKYYAYFDPSAYENWRNSERKFNGDTVRLSDSNLFTAFFAFREKVSQEKTNQMKKSCYLENSKQESMILEDDIQAQKAIIDNYFCTHPEERSSSLTDEMEQRFNIQINRPPLRNSLSKTEYDHLLTEYKKKEDETWKKTYRQLGMTEDPPFNGGGNEQITKSNKISNKVFRCKRMVKESTLYAAVITAKRQWRGKDMSTYLSEKILDDMDLILAIELNKVMKIAILSHKVLGLGHKWEMLEKVGGHIFHCQILDNIDAPNYLVKYSTRIMEAVDENHDFVMQREMIIRKTSANISSNVFVDVENSTEPGSNRVSKNHFSRITREISASFSLRSSVRSSSHMNINLEGSRSLSGMRDSSMNPVTSGVNSGRPTKTSFVRKLGNSMKTKRTSGIRLLASRRASMISSMLQRSVSTLSSDQKIVFHNITSQSQEVVTSHRKKDIPLYYSTNSTMLTAKILPLFLIPYLVFVVFDLLPYGIRESQRSNTFECYDSMKGFHLNKIKLCDNFNRIKNTTTVFNIASEIKIENNSSTSATDDMTVYISRQLIQMTYNIQKLTLKSYTDEERIELKYAFNEIFQKANAFKNMQYLLAQDTKSPNCLKSTISQHITIVSITIFVILGIFAYTVGSMMTNNGYSPFSHTYYSYSYMYKTKKP